MKFKISILTLIISSVLIGTVNAQTFKTGDINKDGTVTSEDAQIILNIARKYDLLNKNDFPIADTDNDGKITALDAYISYIASQGKIELPDVEISTETSTEITTNTSTETSTETTTSIDIPDVLNFSAEGFGRNTTGAGNVSESSSSYAKVSNAEEFGKAIKSGAKVIEITSDIDMGYNSISKAAKNTGIYSSNNSALLHPVLLETGVSKINLNSLKNITIFSKNGAKITHAGFNFSGCQNITIRNIAFDELWEWDEATKGEYDRNDWDYITLQNCSGIWIDHCTFGKAYDGVIDMKKGSNKVTISWCKFLADDCLENSFVMKQLDKLESNMSSYPMYKYLRQDLGFSKLDIARVSAGQKKTHLVGSNEFDSTNPSLEITLANNYYQDAQDRMPRLRAGNAHVYNTIMDSSQNRKTSLELAAKLANVSAAYHFGITSNGALSTEDGAVMVENCVMRGITRPLANNQKSASKDNYTGKIKAVNTLYELDGKIFLGGSDDAGTPLVPNGANVIKAFSWNKFTELPYTYTLIDPRVLEDTIKSSTGAGSVDINWLANSYN